MIPSGYHGALHHLPLSRHPDPDIDGDVQAAEVDRESQTLPVLPQAREVQDLRESRSYYLSRLAQIRATLALGIGAFVLAICLSAVAGAVAPVLANHFEIPLKRWLAAGAFVGFVPAFAALVSPIVTRVERLRACSMARNDLDKLPLDRPADVLTKTMLEDCKKLIDNLLSG